MAAARGTPKKGPSSLTAGFVTGYPQGSPAAMPMACGVNHPNPPQNINASVVVVSSFWASCVRFGVPVHRSHPKKNSAQAQNQKPGTRAAHDPPANLQENVAYLLCSCRRFCMAHLPRVSTKSARAHARACISKMISSRDGKSRSGRVPRWLRPANVRFFLRR